MCNMILILLYVCVIICSAILSVLSALLFQLWTIFKKIYLVQTPYWKMFSLYLIFFILPSIAPSTFSFYFVLAKLSPQFILTFSLSLLPYSSICPFSSLLCVWTFFNFRKFFVDFFCSCLLSFSSFFYRSYSLHSPLLIPSSHIRTLRTYYTCSFFSSTHFSLSLYFFVYTY